MSAGLSIGSRLMSLAERPAMRDGVVVEVGMGGRRKAGGKQESDQRGR